MLIIPLRKVCFLILLALIPALANALVITLEPDDYGLDVPLENEYVTVAATDGWSDLSTLNAITAELPDAWDADYKAPTGQLTFGNFGFSPGGDTQGGLVRGWGGLVLRFNQGVSRVTMLANSGYREQWFNSAGWIAYDRYGEEIGFGSAGVREQESHATFEIDIRRDDIWTVIMGGAETIPYIYFDHLTFELADASVPEPNPFILLMISLAVLALSKRKRASPECRYRADLTLSI
jgi:hypothetical protein